MLEKERDKRPASLSAAVDDLAQAARTAGVAIPQASPLSLTSLEPPREVSTQTLATAQTLIGSSSEVGRFSTSTASRTRRLMILGVAAVSLVAGVLLVVAFHGPASTATSAGTVTAPTAAASSTAPIASAAPSATAPTEGTDVLVSFDGQPVGTKVFRGTALLGTAPGTVRLPKGSGTVELRLEAPTGYLSKTMQVGTDSNTVISMTLEAAPKVGLSASQGPKPKPTGSSDLENPF
jgi:hypothetical protein